MKAMVIRSHGAPDVLHEEDIETPEPAAGEARIRVRGVSVNAFLDVSNRAGRVPFARYTFPHVLGSEHAGEIAAYGPETSGSIPVGTMVVVESGVACGQCDSCLKGSRDSCERPDITGVTRPGAYAQFTVAPVENLRPLPPDCSAVEAAAMAVTGPLATQQLVTAGVEPGSAVLVQAAASASGTMAAIVARAMGCRVFGSTRSAEKQAQLEQLGIYDAVLVSTDDQVLDTLRDAAGGGVDVVIDNVGSPETWDLSMASLGACGRVICSGAMFGGTVALESRPPWSWVNSICPSTSSNATRPFAHSEAVSR